MSSHKVVSGTVFRFPAFVERFGFSPKRQSALALCSSAIPDGKPGSTFPGIALALLPLLAGCNSSNPSDALALNPPAAQAVAPVVQANCPTVTILDANAIHRVFAGGAKEDPSKLVYQASLSDTTRSCSMNAGTLTVNVLAQGRLVPGPLAKPGRITLPIRVTVMDGDGEVFSELTSFAVEVPAGPAGTQFIFNNDHVAIANAPGGAPRTTQVFIGFDTGAPRKGKRTATQ